MKLCVIPARLGSTRFPNKPLFPILDFPMVGHVALRCKLESIFDEVIVATCDKEIVDFCDSINVRSIMTSQAHERASDRVQEATHILEKQIGGCFSSVTMVQGDEPMVTPTMLKAALNALGENRAKVVNLRSRIFDEDEYLSPNCVKVVTNLNDMALYFSREPVPSRKKFSSFPEAFKQICIIPFERSFLDTYSMLRPTQLEIVESIDMNRVLEHGHNLYCPEVREVSYPVDTLEDVPRVENCLKKCRYTLLYNKK